MDITEIYDIIACRLNNDRENGFDINECGFSTNNEGLYGRGIYFSDDIYCSLNCSNFQPMTNDNTKINYVFACT